MQHSPIDPFNLFTGGKTPELAIFYNLACDNIENYIRSIDSSIEKPLSSIDAFSDKVLNYLRQYLWKGNLDNKNNSGHSATAEEKIIICSLLQKLEGIRNFHSHIWHDNAVIEFTRPLANFIEERHDNAVLQVGKEKNNTPQLYLNAYQKYPLFDKKNGKLLITQDTRIFLLSFFLNKGEMNSLLQLTTGTKRNDSPEYRFKRNLYTYYCHREGAAWNNASIENEELSKQEEEEQQRILNGRKAFQIISYLNDKPAYLNQQLPLYYTNNDGIAIPVTGMPSLREYIKRNHLLQDVRISLRIWDHTLPDNPTDNEKLENEYTKMIELKRREGVGYLKWAHNNEHEFEITYSTLLHIVTDIVMGRQFEKDYNENDIMRTKHFTAEQYFYKVLEDAIASREYIYNSLLSQQKDTPINFDSFKIQKLFNSIYIDHSQSVDSIDHVFYTKDQLRHLPISATPKLDELLINWHHAFTTAQKNEPRQRAKLLNYIRPASKPLNKAPYINKQRQVGIPLHTDPQPLLFHLSYYYKEQEQKMRTEDRFLEWAVQYLLHFKLLPNCHIEVERYVYEQKPGEPTSEYKLKPQLQYVQNIPTHHRLRIRDGQVTLAIENTTGRGPVRYKFRLGEKLVKYLLYCCFDKETVPLKTVDGFMMAIAADYAKIFDPHNQPIDHTQFQLLEPFAIPDLLYKMGIKDNRPKQPAIPQRQELIMALTNRLKWIKTQLAGRERYNRHQKNKAILKAYTFYDFSQVAHNKFLRKNEYNQMSICHYMLNQNVDKVMDLIDHTFKLKQRLPKAIYHTIADIVKEDRYNLPHSRLDALFITILNNRKAFIEDMLDMVSNTQVPLKAIRSQLEHLNLPLSDSSLNEQHLTKKQEYRTKTLPHIPFAIHPALALKYFYPTAFAAKGFDGNTPHSKGEKKYNNLFALLRKNALLTTLLVKEHYSIAVFEDLYNKSIDLVTTVDEKAVLKKQLKQLIGQLTDTYTKDVFLSMMAQEYIKAYDSILAQQFITLRGKKQLNIARLFTDPIVIPLHINEYHIDTGGWTQEEKALLPQKIHISFRMHQTDDHFFRIKKDKRYQLALHFQNFRKEELEYYKAKPEFYDDIVKWPDGTQEHPIPLGHLLQERKNIAGMAKKLTGHILQYEKTVIDRYMEQEQQKDSNKSKQDCIVSIDKKDHTHLKFWEVQQLDTINTVSVKKTINDLRVKCLHSLIPLNGSYSKLAAPGSQLAKALSITQRLAPDREKYKEYERKAIQLTIEQIAELT